MVDSLLDRDSNTSESNRADGNSRWTTRASAAEPSEVNEHLLNLARALARPAAQEDDAAERGSLSLRFVDDRSVGSLFEAMLAAYEASGGGLASGAMPAAEASAGRTREFRAWASQPVFDIIGEVAADRHMSVSGLIENLLAREVARLDPDGSRFGVKIET